MEIKTKLKKPNCVELSKDDSIFSDDFNITEEILKQEKPFVAIFGGSGIAEESPYFQKAKNFASLISDAGISVITGGGPGIMQAGNMGAKLSNSQASSYGLRVAAIKGENIGDSPFIDQGCLFTFNTLAIRMLTLISLSDAIVLFPGGFGTLEELFSLLVRIRVKMMENLPVYLCGREFWSGLIDWLSTQVLDNKAISPEDLKLFKLEDNIEKIAKEIISQLTCSD